MTLFVIANWMQGDALSGGDRIFIELSRRWISKIKIKLFISQEGLKICNREKLEGVEYDVWASDKFRKSGYLIDYLYRTFNSIVHAFRLKLKERDIVYSSSDFWPDALAGLILKIRNKNIRWIAGFYLFAPAPWNKDTPYKGISCFTGFFYWVTQKPIYFLANFLTDFVFVTCETDQKRFIIKKRTKDRVVVIQGGVDLSASRAYLNSQRVISHDKRLYDACFIGRFHPQKGVLGLIDIWKNVCLKRPDSKLVMIGSGPLERAVREKIKSQGLEKQIEPVGFKNGVEKFEIFKNSKMVVHPATYDSGGMAAAEAMAWGLPAVGFNLEALDTYYAQGMLKAACFDLNEFAHHILALLEDKVLYARMSREALHYIETNWEWDKRADQILMQIIGK